MNDDVYLPEIYLLRQGRNLESFVRWVANTVHQNYHGKTDGWRHCDKPICREARKVLGIEKRRDMVRREPPSK